MRQALVMADISCVGDQLGNFVNLFLRFNTVLGPDKAEVTLKYILKAPCNLMT